jgi:hypothetical protein
MRMREINVPFIIFSIAGFFFMGAALSGAVFRNPNLDLAGAISESATEISGILIAAIAAFIAFFNSIRQGSISIQMKKDELEREQYAARAILVLALSEICDYSRNCLSYLTSHLDLDGEASSNAPRLSDNVISAIRDNIKFSEENNRASLIEISEKIQLQIARMPNSGDEFRNLDLHYCDYVHDILLLYVASSNLFNYARINSANHVMTVESAYRVNRQFISGDPDVIAGLSRRYGLDID